MSQLDLPRYSIVIGYQGVNHKYKYTALNWPNFFFRRLLPHTQNLIANLSVSQSGLNNVSDLEARRQEGVAWHWQIGSKSFDSTFGVFNLI